MSAKVPQGWVADPYAMPYEWFLEQADEGGLVFLLAYRGLLLTIRDPEWVRSWVDEVLVAEPKAVRDYGDPRRSKKACGFLMGAVLRRNPALDAEQLAQVLRERMDTRS